MDNSDQTLSRMYQPSQSAKAPIAVPEQAATTAVVSPSQTTDAHWLLTSMVLSAMGVVTIAVWVLVVMQGK